MISSDQSDISMYLTHSGHSLSQMSHEDTEMDFAPSPDKAPPSALSFNGNTLGRQNNDSMLLEGTFCHRGNVEECLGFLNQEVTSFGLPSLYEANSSTHSISRLVNCTYTLLQKYTRLIRIREELENRASRQEADNRHLRESQESLKRQLSHSKQETAQAQERERQLGKKIETLTAKLKLEKEELRKLQSSVQHRDTQYKHELRKKEGENNKLKERLHKTLSDKKGAKSGINISNVIGRQDGKRGEWTSGSKQEEELYLRVINNSEEKQRELVVENLRLRQDLSDVQQEVIKAYREALLDNRSGPSQVLSPPSAGTGHHIPLTPGGSEDLSQKMKLERNLSEESSSANVSGDLEEGHFQMPYEYLEGNILETVKEKCRQLRGHIRRIAKRQLAVDRVSKVSPVKKAEVRSQTSRQDRDTESQKVFTEPSEGMIKQKHDPTECHSEVQISITRANQMNKAFLKKSIGEDQDFAFEMNSNKENHTELESAIQSPKKKQILDDRKPEFLDNQLIQMTPVPVRNMQQDQVKCKRSLPSTPMTLNRHGNPYAILETPNFCQPPDVTPNTRDLYRYLGLRRDENGEIRRPAGLGQRPISARETRAALDSSPAWAFSDRLRPSSAVSNTAPSGEQQHSRQIEPKLQDHVDNIRMMLFSQNGDNGSAT